MVGGSAVGAASARQFQLLCRSSKDVFHNRDGYRRAISQSHGNLCYGSRWRSRPRVPRKESTKHSPQQLGPPTALYVTRYVRAASTTTSRNPNAAPVPARPTTPLKVIKPNTGSSFEPPPRPSQPFILPSARDTDELSTVPPILQLENSKYRRPKPLYDALDPQPNSSSALWQGHSPEEPWKPKEGTFLYELGVEAENLANARAGRPTAASKAGDQPYANSEAAATLRIWDRFKQATTGDGRFISALVYMVIIYWILEQLRQAPDPKDGEERPEKRKKRKRGELESPAVKNTDEPDASNASVPVMGANASATETVPAEGSVTPLEALAQVLDPGAVSDVDAVSVAIDTKTSAAQQLSELNSRARLTEQEQTAGQVQDTERDETGGAHEKADKPASSWVRWLKIW